MSKSKSTSKSEKIFINKEDLRDYIHSIHDDLRNSGAGYGQTGLKIFSVFYGLKLIKPNLNKLKLTDKQKKILDWDELVKKVNNINENNRGEIIEYIDKDVLEVLWKLKNDEKNELGYFIFHQIPRDLKDDVWKKLILKIDKIPVGYNKDGGSVNLSGKVWEYFVGRDKTAISELGAFFTDRPVTDFCFNKVKPKLDENEEEQLLMDGDYIDLEAPIRDAIVLSLPINPVCDEECEGLCPGCGVKWSELPQDHVHEEIDSRWSGLKGLFGDLSGEK